MNVKEIAELFDRKASISIVLVNSVQSPRLTIRVHDEDEMALLYKAKELFGGSISAYRHRSHRGSDNYRTCCQYYLFGKGLGSALDVLKDHMIDQAEQVKLGLEATTLTMKRGQEVSEANYEKRMQIKKALSELNNGDKKEQRKMRTAERHNRRNNQ